MPRRLAASALTAALAAAVVPALAVPAAADASCVDDPVGDVSVGAADVVRHCLSATDGTISLTVHMAEGSGATTVGSGGRAVRWQVVGETVPATMDVSGWSTQYVVSAGPDGAVVQYSHELNDPYARPLCTATKVSDDPHSHALSFPGWCLPRGWRVAAAPAVTAGEATDSADATPLVPNALAPVDRRYSELEATRSPLGAPIGAQTTGPGTTVRRLYERG